MTFAKVLVNGVTNFNAIQFLVKLAKYAKTFHKHPRMSTRTHTHTHLHPCMQAQAKQVKLHVWVCVCESACSLLRMYACECEHS